ncbi:DUF6308 family protein [Rhodococcus opacus]|uniref:DUF6308 family protein n=1 Tax=Rhodococcus opacus TaxID=37919 RepID=A0AAX3YVQ1_RHOOP|nr:DUF6308 family protein [Rhodococcus opacus]MCZ4590634.1 DUF6308 family protein [Rhodococcus opacus]WLF51567.1 DUF6308 family protein [Rhodococcus opacus]WLF52636.1 DUF6308 family protein [Rhodococcus opacus]
MRGDPGRRGGGAERASGGGGPGSGPGFDEPDPLTPGWPAWDLETALRGLRDVGGMKATKLIARKRPRLFPIFGFGGVPGAGHRAGTSESGPGGPAGRRRRVASPAGVDPRGRGPRPRRSRRCGCSV